MMISAKMGAAIVLIAVGPLLVLPAQGGEQITLPEISVPLPPTDDDQKVGRIDGRTLERLNKQLKRKVDEINLTIDIPHLDARSPDISIGVINIPGVQQQYGKNFGLSAVPYRPGALVYSSALAPRR
jgi:hypothetical protein